MGRLRIDRITGPPGVLRTGDGVVLAARCHRASRWPARLIGLLATPDLTAGEALWIAPCASVHAVGLRAPIGCAFLDGDGRVLRVVDPLPRGRMAATAGARAVVECHAGILAAVRPGDRLRLGLPVRENPAPSGRPVTAPGVIPCLRRPHHRADRDAAGASGAGPGGR